MPETSTSNHRSLSQHRSEHAWRSVDRAVAQLKDTYPEYVNLVKKLPSMLSTNGLGQTLAFLAAKAKTNRAEPAQFREDNAHGLLYRHLEDWLFRRRVYVRTDVQSVGIDEPLILLLSCGTTARYRQATAEVQAYLVWLKQYAESRERKKDKPHKKGGHFKD